VPFCSGAWVSSLPTIWRLGLFWLEPWLPGGHFKAIAKNHQSGFKLR
jgi:hypothetical protein